MTTRQLHVVGHLRRVVHLVTVVETRALARRAPGAGHLLFSVGVGVLPGIDLPGGDLAAADHLLCVVRLLLLCCLVYQATGARRARRFRGLRLRRRRRAHYTSVRAASYSRAELLRTLIYGEPSAHGTQGSRS